MSRFYLTLPSNSSMDYYPQNTVAQYTTKLNSLIGLDGEWEVGLAEVSFPFEIGNVLEGECYFTISQTDVDESIKVTIPAGHYKDVEHLGMQIKMATMRQLKLSTIEKVPIAFFLLKTSNRVQMRLYQNITVQFGIILARLLGFRHGVMYSGDSVLADSKMRIRSLVRSVYVYCDLVEHVFVGDTKAPLLRIVNRTAKGGENVQETFNPVLYVPLQKKCFDDVEINLMTDTGIPVPFRFGKSFVVLEFRRTVYKYLTL